MLYLLNTGSVQFATGRAEIAPASSPLIGRLAHLAQRCPDAKLEVSGYTDNLGQPAVNLRLSKSRADAVVAALTRAGVDAKRLTGIGHGAGNPVAPNDTDAGQSQKSAHRDACEMNATVTRRWDRGRPARTMRAGRPRSQGLEPC